MEILRLRLRLFLIQNYPKPLAYQRNPDKPTAKTPLRALASAELFRYGIGNRAITSRKNTEKGGEKVDIADADVQLKVEADVKLKDQERQQLATILGCYVKDLPKELEPYARAALQEYLTLFLGQKVFTRGDDFREFRLFLLIREGAFENKIPSEQEVSKLFQTTASQSRSLLRAVFSKYHYDLQEDVEKTLRSTLEEAVPIIGGNYEITARNKYVVDRLNERLSACDAKDMSRVMLKTRSVSTYKMDQPTYECLCRTVHIEPKEPVWT